ncbi:MAG TPA: ABC transporter substrate-binding protein [Candidatus Sulfotelmatobacter sp.]|jgi:ABC-type transport system substrate-binding protein
MKRFDWRWLVIRSAVSAIFIAALAAHAETRPQYGGVLRIAMRAAPTSLDPADSQSDSFTRRSITLLMFDTLVTYDENSGLQPSLAASWQESAGNQRGSQHWQFRIRPGVKFHDGTPLSAEIAAGALRAANPAWRVSADADSVVIEADDAPELPAELALPRNAIVKRNSDNLPIGSGAFHVVDWQPGKKLSLAAEENCWNGRPFIDAIEVEMGKSLREQMTELELGKVDLVEVAPEQSRLLNSGVSHEEGRRVESSAPIGLLALLFNRDAASQEDKLLREALALSVERASIRNVLLQGAGEPAGSVLPNWMSGYEFVFPTEADLPRARHAREQVHTIPMWTLGYDGTDAGARLLAERLALNAKDAGLWLQPRTAANADLRLVEIPLVSPNPWISLASVSGLIGAAGKESGSVEDLYRSEVALLATQRLIPLFHLPVSYAGSANLKNWSLRADGSWNLSEAWLGPGKQVQ